MVGVGYGGDAVATVGVVYGGDGGAKGVAGGGFRERENLRERERERCYQNGGSGSQMEGYYKPYRRKFPTDKSIGNLNINIYDENFVGNQKFKFLLDYCAFSEWYCPSIKPN